MRRLIVGVAWLVVVTGPAFVPAMAALPVGSAPDMPDDPFAERRPAVKSSVPEAETKGAVGRSSDQHWFAPPEPLPGSLAHGGQQMDMRQVGGEETIVVTATRRPIQRDPHDVALSPDDSPAHSLAATPAQGNAGQGACHSSAYQTIAGQPATGMDMISEGGGRCE